MCKVRFGRKFEKDPPGLRPRGVEQSGKQEISCAFRAVARVGRVHVLVDLIVFAADEGICTTHKLPESSGSVGRIRDFDQNSFALTEETSEGLDRTGTNIGII